MSNLLVALDESAAGDLLTVGQNTLGSLSASGNDSLGPFDANWNANTAFSGGTIALLEPDIIRIADLSIDFSASIGFAIDLNDFLPEFCLPRVCVRIPFIGEVCTPRICIDWPVIPIGPVSHSGSLDITADFKVKAEMDGTDWKIIVVIDEVPELSLDVISTAILVVLTAAISAALLLVPFIGPFLALAGAAIAATLGVAAITGLLGRILTPLISGLEFEVYRRPQIQTVIPDAGPADPVVNIRVTSLTSAVQSSDEDELVIKADIAPV